MRPQLGNYLKKAQEIADTLDAKVAAIQAKHDEMSASFSKDEAELILRVLSGKERVTPIEDQV